MPRNQTGTVYALVDPRDGKIRYIGKTTQPILNRLAGHLAQPTNPAMRVWINSLSLQGFTPLIETVSTPAATALDAEEQRQIRRYAKQGHRLLNAPYYKAHLADLSSAPARAPETDPEPEQETTLEHQMAWWFYGWLARARAEGRVSTFWELCFVVFSAPLYMALLILRRLLGAKVVRRLALGLLCAFPCWVSGFNRAVQDLIFAHLPLAESAKLWAVYGAGPLRTLVHDMTWPMLITSVLMAGADYTSIDVPREYVDVR